MAIEGGETLDPQRGYDRGMGLREGSWQSRDSLPDCSRTATEEMLVPLWEESRPSAHSALSICMELTKCFPNLLGSYKWNADTGGWVIFSKASS